MINAVHERLMASGIFAAAIYLIYLSMDFPWGSRVFPLAILGLMAVLSAVVFIRTLYSDKYKDETATSAKFFRHPVRFLLSVGVILSYVVLLPILGYFTTSVLFFLAMTAILGYRNYKNIALTIVTFLAFVYAVFVVLFERPIPPEFFQTY